jgi:isopenicillin N synthase-like dioxygenase
LSFAEASASGIWGDDNDQAPTQPSEEDRARGEVLASDAAILMTEEIMDDGRPLGQSFDNSEGPVSMSPHRICRYANDGQSNKKRLSEVFGAHTDTSFVTIVPAAAVSGLEVFDEDELKWYRPELYARKHSKNLDSRGAMNEKFPWHSRYLVVMPGELLQITSRDNVPAAVHRVVAANEAARLSAPVLLRARPGTVMDVERYMGSLDNANSVLLECNGMKMEDIHDALQVKPLDTLKT